MKSKNDRQRLFEVMGRLDKTFIPRLNEDVQGKSFTLNLFGEETPVSFSFDHYMNGALCVGLVDEEGPYSDVSVNLPESGSLPKDLYTNSCGFYFESYGVCNGTCPNNGVCRSVGRSCYCQ